MNDRELLVLAAEAVGIDPAGVFVISGYSIGSALNQWWDPLTDDGDALKLAVSVPAINLQAIIAEAWQACEEPAERYAYVRRGIVSAVAEIELAKAS